jgi:TonB-linked SusC/RagA family outer membrane protein
MMKIFTYLIFMLLPFGVIAQVRTVTGKVTSSDDGMPLPGVSVVVQGTNKGTATDAEGQYSLELGSSENTLVFTFVGYKAQTVSVGERTAVDIVLAIDEQILDEVVVIGYGTVRKSDLTGSVSSVRGGDLTKIPAASPMQALQGKVAGVQITTNNGAPGAGPVVRVRGVGTFNNSDPIYVVDGVILGDINFLNAADIQSIEVLKDASGTAIYGSRGANGVVLITTKRGTMGKEGMSVNVSAEYSIQKLQNKIDLLSGREFAIIANELRPGSFNNVDAVPNTDWQDQVFQTAPIQNYQVSVTGASQKMEYYLGIGYFNHEGIIPKSNYERVTLRFNNTYRLGNAVRVGSNLNFTPYKQQNTYIDAAFNSYRAQPTITPLRPDGTYSPVPGVGNPLASIEYTNNFDNALRTVSNIFGEVDILKGLTFRSSFGVDMEYKKNRSFTPQFFVNAQQENSTSDLTKLFEDRANWLWENTLSYNKQIGKNRIGAVAGYTMQNSTTEKMEVVAENILRDGEDLWYINPDNINGGRIKNEVNNDNYFSMISYLFRVNYTFDERYLFTATYRRDGSSKFIKKNRFADFPSLAVGWNVINERFMEDTGPFSNLKVRASWGVVGNEKITYERQYSGVNNGVGAVFGTNETLYPGSTYGESGNENLRWEETHQIDAGVEMGFFDDRLTAEIDYYHKTTKDILINLPVPGYLGNGVSKTVTYNAAEALNRGFEYNVSWKSEWKDLRYRIGTVGTTIHNEVLKVFGSKNPDDKLFNGNSTTATSVGRPIGSFYGYVVDGIFQNAAELNAYPHRSDAGVGDLRFVDVNPDNVLTSDDRTYIGSPIPTFLYGLNLEAGYKSFDLSVDFQGQSGNKIYNEKETVRVEMYNFEQHVVNRWKGEGTSQTEPKASIGGYNFLPSTRFVQDGSFFRLRSVTLSYKLPSTLLTKMKMSAASMYIRGTNLFTLTDYTGYSPEVGYPLDRNQSGVSSINTGLDTGTYPVCAIYSIGMNLTF